VNVKNKICDILAAFALRHARKKGLKATLIRLKHERSGG